MTFRPWRWDIQDTHDTFAIWLLDCILGVVADRENRWLGWPQFPIANLKQDIARTQADDVRRPSFMNVLEHPTLFPVEIAAHKGGTDSVASGDVPALGVAKSRVARL